MRYRSFGFTDPGKIKGINEDSFVCNEDEGIFLVADGIGGRASGEVASRLAVSHVEEFVRNSRANKIQWPIKYQKGLSLEQNRLLAAAFSGNLKIRDAAKQTPSMKGMGTTLIGVLIDGPNLAVVNIGDSRLYRIREDEIKQLTRDQTFVKEQERKGLLTSQEARQHPRRHILTGALGYLRSFRRIDITDSKIKQGDLYLICSDGLYNMIDEKKILAIIQSIKDKSLYKTGLSLVLEANLAGGLDNITAVLLSF